MPRRKKKSATADLIKRIRYQKHKRRAAGRGRRQNPEGAVSHFVDGMKDAGMDLLPALGSFGGSTVLVRLFEKFMKRFETKLGPLSRHSAVLAWAATLITVYLATSKVRALRKYQTPALLGTTIAALVHLLPKYMPALGWLVGQPMKVAAGPGGTKVVMPVTPESEIYTPDGAISSYPALPAASETSGSDEALLQDYEDVQWGGAQAAVQDAEDADLRSGIFGS